MTFGLTHLTLDGSLRNGFVWLTIAVVALAATALVSAVQLLVHRSWPGRVQLFLLAAGAALVVYRFGRQLVHATAAVLSQSTSLHRVEVTLLPAAYPIRDGAPALLVLVLTCATALLIVRPTTERRPG